MGYQATLTSNSQITIPKAVREVLGIVPGQRITFNVSKGRVSIEREKTAAEIAEEIDSLIPADAREYHMRHFAGLTSSSVQEKWSTTDEAKGYFEEEFRRTK